MSKDFFEREAETNPFSPYPQKTVNPEADYRSQAGAGDSVRSDFATRGIPETPDGNFLPFFFGALLKRFKSTLSSMRKVTQIPLIKLNDPKFMDSFFKSINDDLQEIESVLNSLINYIKLNTPIVKSNTVHIVLNEVLRRYERQLEAKGIRIVKKFEKELPETIVHEEQLRYIFNSILEYAIPLTLPKGSIGFMTRVLDKEKEPAAAAEGFERAGRYVEIVIAFTGVKKPRDSAEPGATIHPPGTEKDESLDLKLLLVKEIVRKNFGVLKLTANEKAPKTHISLTFPVERRKIVYYQLPDF